MSACVCVCVCVFARARAACMSVVCVNYSQLRPGLVVTKTTHFKIADGFLSY